MSTTFWFLLFALLSASLDNLGQGLQKGGAVWFESGPKGLLKGQAVGSFLVWVLGILMCIAAPFVLASSLSRGPATFAAALGVFGLVPLYLYASLVLRETVTRWHVAALVLILGGTTWIGWRSLDGEDDIVLLKDQDRSLWDRELIEEGDRLLREALSSRRFGFYTLQAAISAVHANSSSAEETDWAEILALYNLLARIEPSPVILLNRAVAVSMIQGPQAALAIVDEILGEGQLEDYAALHAARGEWLLQLEQPEHASKAYETALSHCSSESEKRFFEKKLAECRSPMASFD